MRRVPHALQEHVAATDAAGAGGGTRKPFYSGRGDDMSHINANRLGIVFAVMMVALHAMWLAVVAAGAGQPLADFVMRIHLVDTSSAVVTPFSAANAALLLIVAGVAGYAVGSVSGMVWNGVSWLAEHDWSKAATLSRKPAKHA
jgi:hypothetical protein